MKLRTGETQLLFKDHTLTVTLYTRQESDCHKSALCGHSFDQKGGCKGLLWCWEGFVDPGGGNPGVRSLYKLFVTCFMYIVLHITILKGLKRENTK